MKTYSQKELYDIIEKHKDLNKKIKNNRIIISTYFGLMFGIVLGISLFIITKGGK